MSLPQSQKNTRTPKTIFYKSNLNTLFLGTVKRNQQTQETPTQTWGECAKAMQTPSGKYVIQDPSTTVQN